MDLDAVLSCESSIDNQLLVDSALAYLNADGVFERTRVIPHLYGGLRSYSKATPLIDSGLKEIGATRAHTRLQRIRLDKAIRSDDIETATPALEELLSAVRHIAYQGLYVDASLDCTVRGTVSSQIAGLASCGQVSPAMAAALLPVLSEYQQTYAIARSFRIEQFIALDAVQHLYTDDGTGDGRMIVQEMLKLGSPNDDRGAWVNLAGMFVASRREVEADIKATFITAATIADKSFRDRIPMSPLRQRSSLGKLSFSLTPIMFPDVKELAARADSATQQYHSAMIACALIVHHANHGEYPAKLSELAPLLPAAALSDPLAPDTQFIYIRSENAYSLWSTGTDGDNDHGIMAPRDQNANKGRQIVDGDILLLPR